MGGDDVTLHAGSHKLVTKVKSAKVQSGAPAATMVSETRSASQFVVKPCSWQ